MLAFVVARNKINYRKGPSEFLVLFLYVYNDINFTKKIANRKTPNIAQNTQRGLLRTDGWR
jgi:hypothetical protein